MWRYMVGIALVGVVAAPLLNQYSGFENQSEQSSLTAGTATVQQTATVQNSSEDYSGRKARVKMDSRGHFVTKARMNGRQVEVLVDTGATSVAINRSTAKRLGIRLKQSDFKYKVETANGSTKAAAATIDRIEIGRVTVRNVRAAVLDDKALSSTLLGMTFLGELRKFEVKNRELVLEQ